MNTENKNDFTQYTVAYWDVINTLDEEKKTCQSLLKNGKVCGKACSIQHNDNFTCKTHAPKDVKLTKKNEIKCKKVKDFLLQDIALRVISTVEEIWNQRLGMDMCSKLTRVSIELQPKVNNKMKFTSHIIYAKLVELVSKSGFEIPVRFIRAVKKMKVYKGPEIECKLKGDYAKRKFLAVRHVQWFLGTQFNEEQKEKWNDFYNHHTKKDDLADTFLMCISELQNGNVVAKGA
jgi:hypothetical protein